MGNLGNLPYFQYYPPRTDIHAQFYHACNYFQGHTLQLEEASRAISALTPYINYIGYFVRRGSKNVFSPISQATLLAHCTSLQKINIKKDVYHQLQGYVITAGQLRVPIDFSIVQDSGTGRSPQLYFYSPSSKKRDADFLNPKPDQLWEYYQLTEELAFHGDLQFDPITTCPCPQNEVSFGIIV